MQCKVTVVRPRVPWYSSELKLLKAKRRKLERKMRKSNLPSDIQEYKRVCNEYCAMLKCAKKDHYSDLIEESAGESKKLFRVVNSLCNEPLDNLLPPHSCSQQLANDFGEFFCCKIELIKEDIGQESVCELPTYDISCPSAKLERFSLVSDEQIWSIIMSASSASCQLDPIPTWLVKQCAKELAPIFAKMINSSLTSGVIPENWKLALVIPLLKKLGLELIFNSFRPVSNLLFIS